MILLVKGRPLGSERVNSSNDLKVAVVHLDVIYKLDTVYRGLVSFLSIKSCLHFVLMYIQGNKPYLTGLLSMYKIHRPNLVTMATSASNKVSVGGCLKLSGSINLPETIENADFSAVHLCY